MVPLSRHPRRVKGENTGEAICLLLPSFLPSAPSGLTEVIADICSWLVLCHLAVSMIALIHTFHGGPLLQGAAVPQTD